MCTDGFKNGGRARQHIVVPDADDPISLCLEPAIPAEGAFAVGMLTAVEFNERPAISAEHIDNVWPN